MFIARLFVPLQPQTGRDARVVEWTALEMRRTLTGTLGSNPSLSAEYSKKREFQGPLFIFRKSPALKDRLDAPIFGAYVLIHWFNAFVTSLLLCDDISQIVVITYDIIGNRSLAYGGEMATGTFYL